jgi:hypothetical protein
MRVLISLTAPSQPFSYHAETDSLALQKLSQNIWQSFKDEDRTNIDGTSNNKGKILGQDYLRLTIIQLSVSSSAPQWLR